MRPNAEGAGRSTSRTDPHRRGGHRSPTLMVAVFTLLIPTLLLTSSIGSAALTPYNDYPPYTGTHTVQANTVTTSGCSSASAPKAKWNASTGMGTQRVGGSASWCTPAVQPGAKSSEGLGVENTSITLPITIAKNGFYSVYPNMSFTWKGHEAMTVAGSCPLAPNLSSGAYTEQMCVVASYFALYVGSYVFDATNQTELGNSQTSLAFGQSYLDNASYCTGGSCSSAQYTSSSTSSYSNGTLTFYQIDDNGWKWIHTHHYFLVVYVLSYAEGIVDTYPSAGFTGATATASLDLSKGGDGWSLNWIFV